MPANILYFVSAAGNDTTAVPNDPTRPYRSPRGAYADIPSDITGGTGDHVIRLMDGSTYGQLHITAKLTDAGHRLVVEAADGVTPTLDAHSTADGSVGERADNPALRIDANYVVVQGLRFNNTSLDTLISRYFGGAEVMVRLEGSHVTFTDNYFDGNERAPTIKDIFLYICGAASENVISDNRFDFSGGKSLIHISASCGRGRPGRQIIRNNVLSRFGNKPQFVCAAINFGGASGTLAGHNSVVETNTIYDNGDGCYGLLNTNGSILTVRNNIFSKITGHRYAIGCSGVGGASSGIAHNSLMYGNTNDVEARCGAGGGWKLDTYYSEDPHFVDTAAAPPDLHVQSTTGSRRSGTLQWTTDEHCSVAIDRASAAEAFDREPVPNGGRRNLGAYGNTPEASKSCAR
ncbi:MAG: hypothetical protein ACRELD_07110 [Longimicrobiales bacterium]